MNNRASKILALAREHTIIDEALSKPIIIEHNNSHAEVSETSGLLNSSLISMEAAQCISSELQNLDQDTYEPFADIVIEYLESTSDNNKQPNELMLQDLGASGSNNTIKGSPIGLSNSNSPTKDKNHANCSMPANEEAKENYPTENETDSGNSDEDIPKRKKKPEKASWFREQNKKRRMEGKPYMGFGRDETGKACQQEERGARIMGPKCTSNKCAKYRNRYCALITEEERNKVFKIFWEQLSWDQKKIYISSLVEKVETKRPRVESSRKSNTYKYFLKIENTKKQVCKKMFLGTLGIREWMVHNWCTKGVAGMHASREKQKSNKQLELANKTKENGAMQYLRSFLQELPKMPSHYCRQRSS
ncbi:unnamed protein product, partial [Callosobruchus maculatus]